MSVSEIQVSPEDGFHLVSISTGGVHVASMDVQLSNITSICPAKARPGHVLPASPNGLVHEDGKPTPRLRTSLKRSLLPHEPPVNGSKPFSIRRAQFALNFTARKISFVLSKPAADSTPSPTHSNRYDWSSFPGVWYGDCRSGGIVTTLREILYLNPCRVWE